MRDRYDSLQPVHLIATMRSLPRRYRAAVTGHPELSPVEVGALVTPEPDGRRVVDLIGDTVRTLALVERSLELVVLGDHVVPAAAVDSSERHWPTDCDTLGVELDALDDVATALADRIESVGDRDWERTGRLTGGGTVTAIELAREAARTGAEHLRAIERLAEAP